MTPEASAGYLAASRESGLLRDLDGCPFVAGEYQDETGGERQCLVEYCHPRLLAGGAARLVTVLREEFPAAGVLVLRASGDVAMPAPWLAHLTYVRLADGGPPRTAPGEISVVPADPGHDELILRWLIRAFEAYGDEQQHRGSPDDIGAVARRVLAADDRRSYVAVMNGDVIGHVTLLCDAYDDVSGRRHVELLDSLVDADGPAHGAALAALTRAAAEHAAGEGLPLIGHVVHPTPAELRAKGDAIVSSLLRRGWVIDHRYWRRPVTGELAGDTTGGTCSSN